MRRLALVLGGPAALAAVLALPPGGSVRPLPLRTPPPATAALTALVGDAAGSRLVRIDPSTFAATRSSRRIGFYDGWVRSPAGRLLAVATHREGAGAPQRSTLRFANAASLRFARRGVGLDGWFRAALWPSPGRLLALVGDCCSSGLFLETVDTVAKRVVSRRALEGAVAEVGRSADGLVLLAQPPDEVGTARLVAIGPDGAVRSVALDRILAGTHWGETSQAPIGTVREPGLAVDPDGGVAYVVDADGLVAAVRLADLSVAYHRIGSGSLLARLSDRLAPAAAAKGANGPFRSAQWLGDGLLAVTGSDESAVKRQDGTIAFSARPAGLSVVDTRDWSLRLLDPAADSATVADGLLLASGGSWESAGSSSTSSGEGIAAYGPDGSLRWRLLAGTRSWVAAAYGDRAVVQDEGSQAYSLVELSTGRVMRSLGSATPWLLLGAGS